MSWTDGGTRVTYKKKQKEKGCREKVIVTPFSVATMDQAVARIHRMTQSKQTYIYTIVMKNTIEETILDDILTRKVTYKGCSIYTHGLTRI